MTVNNKKILILCHEIIQPWTRRDIQILKKYYTIKVLTFRKISVFDKGKIKKLKVIQFIYYRLIDILRLIYYVAKSDFIFGWFVSEFVVAGVLISMILRKKSIVVTGGYDIENIPDIKYGLLQHPTMKYLVKLGLKKSNYILPYSEYTFELVKNLIGNKNNIKIINLGCDTDKFKPILKKEDIVITAGFIDEVYIKRKGFDTFVKAAKYLPDVKFYLIGKQRDKAVEKLKNIAPDNVIFTGFLSDDALLELYQKAKVFCLLSYQEGEGGGGVLGEAMACGCFPVISEKALALKETVGDCGIYVPYGDEKATAIAIEKALKVSDNYIIEARNRIEKFYSLKIREAKLIKIINEIE